ncbi:MAG TPA: bifunctional metallophosphatase/5'-nucleotidase [Thiobacillus sp.]|nr:bifunctional metallophosphatase/5'-nucleotidase [Thiobacillus sp.]HQT69680.1 bifunctional metallophosphatase/5'-nucleotidase [Thiobacillus sp.]
MKIFNIADRYNPASGATTRTAGFYSQLRAWDVLGAVVLFAATSGGLALAGDSAKAEKASSNGGIKITLVQIGDIHGHMIPRPTLRDEGEGGEEGGLARMFTKIEQIRQEKKNVVLFNTGDTIQGSAEALYTRGQALIDVLDRFGIEGMAPGNWDYLYGKDRFLELFGVGTGTGPSATRYGAVAANVYHAGTTNLLLPPYFVKNVNGVKIGVLGLSSERAINALGPFVTVGIDFTADAEEIPGYVDKLKHEEKVDLIILVSEFGLAKNVLIANANPEIDIVLSSDMHEETPREIIAESGAIVSEAGQDGTRIAQLDLVINPGEGGKKIASYAYALHHITDDIKADKGIDSLVRNIRAPFVKGPALVAHTNPINGTVLATPIDKVVGIAEIDLYRGNFSDHPIPGVLEGSSSNFYADVFRDQAGADIGHFRGFRYGTRVRPGPIKLEDIYHHIPIGPQIAKITLTGQQIKNNIENSANGSLNPDVFAWTGGWLNGYGGVRMDIDAYRPLGSRISNVRIQRAATGTWEPLDPLASYTFAGYWYAQDPQVVGGIRTQAAVTVVKGADEEALDGTAVVANYLKNNVANPEMGRVNNLFALPAPVYGNPEIQPLLGVPTIF